MVSRYSLIHFLGIFLLGSTAIAALLLKSCKTCILADPFLPLVGAGYFALLIAMAVFLPRFPGSRMARAGLIWSISLAVSFSYVHYPRWCTNCLVAHACHIAMWTVWILVPHRQSSFKLRLSTTFLVWVLFFSLKSEHQAGLKPGDHLPAFHIGKEERLLINFTSSHCPYCKEQLPLLNRFAARAGEKYRFVNVISTLPSETAGMEWVEDKYGELAQLFKVDGYPMLFVAGKEGLIEQVIAGVPDQMEEMLSQLLGKH